jgi:hypothetical protein
VRDKIPVVFAEALSAHILIIFAVILAQSSSLAGRRESEKAVRETIRQALLELGKEPDNPGFEAGTKEEEDALVESLSHSLKIDAEVDRKEKIAIIKHMIRSYERLKNEQGGEYVDVSELTLDETQALLEQNGMFRLPSGEKAFLTKSVFPEDGFDLYKPGRGDEFQVRRLRRNEPTRKKASSHSPARSSWIRDTRPRRGALHAPGNLFSITPMNPSSPGRVPLHGRAGFPELGGAARGGGRRSPCSTCRDAGAEVPPHLKVYLIRATMPGGWGGIDGRLSTADLSEARMNEILDELMTMPDGKQFAAFEKEYLRRLDPESDDLARLARRFVYTNLNGMFYMTDDFAMAFDFLEEPITRPIYDAFALLLRHPRRRRPLSFQPGRRFRLRAATPSS